MRRRRTQTGFQAAERVKMVPLGAPLVKSLLGGEFLTPVNYGVETTVCVQQTRQVSLDLLFGYSAHGQPTEASH